MRFYFKAVNKKKSEIEGDITAKNESEAIKLLKNKGLTVLSIKQDSFWFQLIRFFSKNTYGLSDQEVSFYFKEIVSVLSTGMSELESIEYLAMNSEENKKFKLLSVVIESRMRNGESMSKAMNASGILKKYTDVVSIGESTGETKVALLSVVEQIELSKKIQKGFNTIYIAPAVSGSIMLLATVAAIIWLVPMQEKIIYTLAPTGVEIPIMSRIAFAIGDYGIQVIVGFVVSIILFFLFKKIGSLVSERIAMFFDVTSLKIPIFGVFYRSVEYARICSMLMLAMSSGNKQEEVLRLIKNQVGSISLKKKIEASHEMVLNQGYLISQALEESGFNGIVVNFVRRGERLDKKSSAKLMSELTKDFSEKALHNMEILKGASEMINMILLTILSGPILMISVAPAVDQITLTMSRF